MSSIAEKLESVENGLKIAEFIQANRTIPPKTYGRSAISKPSTKDRAKAWETFTNSEDSSSRGHEGGAKSSTRNPETESELFNEDNGGVTGSFSPSIDTVTIREDAGTDSGRNVESIAESVENGEHLYIKDHAYPLGGRDPEQRRNEEPQEGGKDNSGSHANDGPNNRGGPINRDDKAPTAAPRNQSIKETTLEDLEEIAEETDPENARPLQCREMIRELKEMIPPPAQVVKKTTDESIQSLPLVERHTSKPGATQDVPLSHQNQESTPADVGNAQEFANSAKESIEGEIEYDDEIYQRLDSVEAKLDVLMENQAKIMTKLNSIMEIKEEISTIKKTLTNQSLAISTVEGYISELMIAIPKSGIPENDENEPKQVNPDLRMVIGRDNTRGKKEITKNYSDKDMIDVSDDILIPPEIDQSYITQPIDNRKNNAANFVPTEDMTSVRIIKSIIIKETRNDNLIEQLFDLIDEHFGVTPIAEIYDTIKELIFLDKNMTSNTD